MMTIAPITAHHEKRRVLLLLLCLFLLLSSGRMDSGDANAELAGSFNLVETGGLGTTTPYTDQYMQSLFVQAPNGRYYEAHDIGNSLLLTPAALAGSLSSSWVSHTFQLTRSSNDYQVKTLIAKTLASLMEIALSAVACFYLFLLFGFVYEARPSLVLTALFVFATFYTAYFRSAWDVLPACNAVIILLYYSAKLIRSPAIRALDAIPVALLFGITCMFRLSLAPFLGLGISIMFWSLRKKVSRSAILTTLSIAIVLFIPTLVFNAVRTGSPLRPANTFPQFHYQTSLSGNLVTGMFGLLLAPNRGLFVFSPILLLLCLLPWYWKSIPATVKSLLRAYLPPTFLYYLMIAKMLNWGAAGWGPRYLLPVLPILFLGTGAIAYRLWFQAGTARRTLVTLCLISVLACIPPLLVDHRSAGLQYPETFSGTTPYPIQHMAVWKALIARFDGHAPPVRSQGTDEVSTLSTVFPDLLITRVHQVLAVRSVAAAQILVVLYITALGCTVYLLWSSVRRREAWEDDMGQVQRQTPLHEKAMQ